MNKYLLILYVIWNVIVYFVYGYDKWQAKREGWRVPEKVLLGMALCFGGVGAWVGMQSFRHKTKHASFKIFVPVCIVINLVLLYFMTDFNALEWWLNK